MLAVSLLVLDYILVSPAFYGTFFFGKITIAVYFVTQTAFLSAHAHRLSVASRRAGRNAGRPRRQSVPALILGQAADVEVLLRAMESGAMAKIWPVGLLSPSRSDRGASVRGVPVLGGFDDLEQVVRPACASDRRR